jgi:dethiobiotin synthetase
MNKIVVAGIGTEVGKTFIAAILTEALEADYWKPVQAGGLDFTDTDFVKKHISNSRSFFHKEKYLLKEPMSPHAAADIDGVQINLNELSLPETTNNLVIETAGGLMVPLNDKELNIDLIQQWNLPVLLVSRIYLGSINHTLLSVEALRSRGIKLLGILFNGEGRPSTEDFIINYTKAKRLGRIGEEALINKDAINKYVSMLRKTMNEVL